MESVFYLAGLHRPPGCAAFARLGYGFTESGALRAPTPEGEILVLDDRALPSEEGLRNAAALFSSVPGLLLCDFERPPQDGLIRLLEQLPPERLIVPPSYEALPHRAIFLPPYRAAQPFLEWLAEQRRRYGSIVLDLQPFLPGKQVQPPDGHFSEALCCHYRAVLKDGTPSFQFYDTLQSYHQRLALAQAPCIALQPEYDRLSIPSSLTTNH